MRRIVILSNLFLRQHRLVHKKRIYCFIMIIIKNKEPSISVYLAGPMSGVTSLQTHVWRNQLKSSARFMDEMVYSRITWLDPTRGLPSDNRVLSNDDLDEYRGNFLFRPKTVLARDYADVKRADIVIAGLRSDYHGTVPISIGTCIEIGWCHAFQKPLLVIAEDGSEYKKHPMISSIATSFVENVSEAIEFLDVMLHETSYLLQPPNQ